MLSVVLYTVVFLNTTAALLLPNPKAFSKATFTRRSCADRESPANYDDPDPACELAGLSRSTQERRVKVALLNAFGFGSNNAAVVLKQAAI